jgi:hypothetical protein
MAVFTVHLFVFLKIQNNLKGNRRSMCFDLVIYSIELLVHRHKDRCTDIHCIKKIVKNWGQMSFNKG